MCKESGWGGRGRGEGVGADVKRKGVEEGEEEGLGGRRGGEFERAFVVEKKRKKSQKLRQR